MKAIPAFYFEAAELEQLAKRYAQSFRDAVPFPHVVIDDFLPDDVIRMVEQEFPAVDQIDWRLSGPGSTRHTHDKRIEKLFTSDENQFGALTRHLMHVFNSEPVLKFLEELTGIKSLIPDSTFSGCGLHSTGRGGKLMIHTDASRHPNKRFDQMLNLILFVNRGWKEDWGGHLELWSEDCRKAEKRILPVSNRCVVFETGMNSPHGHPYPLSCPEGTRRNSLAVYYYVLDRLKSKNYTGWRPHVDWVPINKEERYDTLVIKSKEMARNWFPPVVLNWLRALKG